MKQSLEVIKAIFGCCQNSGILQGLTFRSAPPLKQGEKGTFIYAEQKQTKPPAEKTHHCITHLL